MHRTERKCVCLATHATHSIGFLAVFSRRKHACQVFFVMCNKLVLQILQNHHSETVFSLDIWVYSYNRAVGTSAPGSTKADHEPHSKMLLHPMEKSKISAFDGESRTCESFRVWLKNDKSWLTRNSAWHFNILNQKEYVISAPDKIGLAGQAQSYL